MNEYAFLAFIIIGLLLVLIINFVNINLKMLENKKILKNTIFTINLLESRRPIIFLSRCDIEINQ